MTSVSPTFSVEDFNSVWAEKLRVKSLLTLVNPKSKDLSEPNLALALTPSKL